MRVEIDIAEAGGAPRGAAGAVLATPRRRARLDGFERATLAIFALFSLWILALDLWQVVVNGRVWTGTDGIYLVDQMQYLAWIREASHHVLASNLFVLHPTTADYFQPGVALSGGLAALGMAPWLSLLLWKPVAVGCAFFAVLAYCRRSLVGLWPRRIALVLALFFGSFSVVYGDFNVVGDLFLGFLSWGYTFGLLAVALMVFALLGYDRARTSGRRIWLPGVLGAAAGLLHPWQGEFLIVLVIGAELVMWRVTGQRLRRVRPALVTLILTGIPLLYYLILGRTDLSWTLAREASKHAFSLGAIALAVLPLAVPALLGYRGRSASFITVLSRTWPVAALAVWVLSATELSATPLHAFDGITIPLAVLAVQGVQRLSPAPLARPRLAAGLALGLFTLPANVYLLASSVGLAKPQAGNANFISADEHSALRYLERNPQRGGVLTRFYLGTIVPAQTGRASFVGDCLWSEPNCNGRAEEAQYLFDGRLSGASARSFVRDSGARFVLADCSTTSGLPSTLAPLTVSITRFGCASVYELDAPGRPTGPLAQSPGNAAVRASWRQ